MEGAICTLTHVEDATIIRLTYDPSAPLYTISVTAADPWPDERWFGMAFYGAQENTIMTDAHELSEDGRTITVTDRGFGNVLDGLQFNVTATAFTGIAVVAVSLAEAAPEVEAFRTCSTAPSA